MVMAGGWKNDKLYKETYFFNLDTEEFEQLGDLSSKRCSLSLLTLEVALKIFFEIHFYNQQIKQTYTDLHNIGLFINCYNNSSTKSY